MTAYWQHGATLLHQQCWCWGQDVRRPEGNLLLEYRFERVRPPEGIDGSSRYTFKRDDTTIVLWGFGVGYSAESRGGIYVNRYCFVPRWLAEPSALEAVWQASQMAGVPRPRSRREIRRSRRLLQSLMRWIAGYEFWVANTQRMEYRRATLAQWPHAGVPPDRLGVEWELLARHVEEPPLGQLTPSLSGLIGHPGASFGPRLDPAYGPQRLDGQRSDGVGEAEGFPVG